MRTRPWKKTDGEFIGSSTAACGHKSSSKCRVTLSVQEAPAAQFQDVSLLFRPCFPRPHAFLRYIRKHGIHAVPRLQLREDARTPTLKTATRTCRPHAVFIRACVWVMALAFLVVCFRVVGCGDSSVTPPWRRRAPLLVQGHDRFEAFGQSLGGEAAPQRWCGWARDSTAGLLGRTRTWLRQRHRSRAYGRSACERRVSRAARRACRGRRRHLRPLARRLLDVPTFALLLEDLIEIACDEHLTLLVVAHGLRWSDAAAARRTTAGTQRDGSKGATGSGERGWSPRSATASPAGAASAAASGAARILGVRCGLRRHPQLRLLPSARARLPRRRLKRRDLHSAPHAQPAHGGAPPLVHRASPAALRARRRLLLCEILAPLLLTFERRLQLRHTRRMLALSRPPSCRCCRSGVDRRHVH